MHFGKESLMSRGRSLYNNVIGWQVSVKWVNTLGECELNKKRCKGGMGPLSRKGVVALIIPFLLGIPHLLPSTSVTSTDR